VHGATILVSDVLLLLLLLLLLLQSLLLLQLRSAAIPSAMVQQCYGSHRHVSAIADG
jgi:hypothetical protein